MGSKVCVGLIGLLLFGFVRVLPCLAEDDETVQTVAASKFDAIASDTGQELDLDLRDALNNAPSPTSEVLPVYDASSDADLSSKDFGPMAGPELEPKFSKFMADQGFKRSLFEGHWHWADGSGTPLSADMIESEFRLFLESD